MLTANPPQQGRTKEIRALGGSVTSPKMPLNRGDWAEFGHADTEHRAEA
jgi:hypothetical protein